MSDWNRLPPPPDLGFAPRPGPAAVPPRLDRPPLSPWAPVESPPTLPPPPPAPGATSAATPPRRPLRSRRAPRLVAAIVAVMALASGGFVLGRAVADDPATVVGAPNMGSDTLTSSPAGPDLGQTAGGAIPAGPVSGDAEEPVAAVAEAVSRSVVRIDTANANGPLGTGSGIVLDAAGHIVTNAHVVQGATSASVRLADGTRVAATILGSDPSVDVAVIAIDSAETPEPATFAPMSAVEVGQLAVAIGSPFGLDQTVTAGIVSAVNRAISNVNVADGSTTIVEMVQTDAPINPGNSGGALADRQGRVVGMNTSIRTDGAGQGNLGVGFAIPSDTILLIADRIISGKSLASGYLGVGLRDPEIGPPGAEVTAVEPGTPAEQAGLQVGDLVVAMNGNPVTSTEGLAARVRLSSPGSVAELEVLRDGRQVTLSATFGEYQG